MTPSSLRTLMAQAFAEETRKYKYVRISIRLGETHDCHVWTEGKRDKIIDVFVGPEAECVEFINERGIAAAMRVAAEHCHDCLDLMNATYSSGTPVKAAFFVLGEMT